MQTQCEHNANNPDIQTQCKHMQTMQTRCKQLEHPNNENTLKQGKQTQTMQHTMPTHLKWKTETTNDTNGKLKKEMTQHTRSNPPQLVRVHQLPQQGGAHYTLNKRALADESTEQRQET